MQVLSRDAQLLNYSTYVAEFEELYFAPRLIRGSHLLLVLFQTVRSTLQQGMLIN